MRFTSNSHVQSAKQDTDHADFTDKKLLKIRVCP